MSGKLYPVRFQAREELGKGFKEFDALRRAGVVRRAFVIAELKNDSYHFLAIGMAKEDVPPLLLVAAEACVHISRNDDAFKLDLPTRLPLRPQKPTGRRREPEVTRAVDGTLEAPPGESFMSCAECGSSRWLCTVADDGGPGRQVCARCGNEIVHLRIVHGEGRA